MILVGKDNRMQEWKRSVQNVVSYIDERIRRADFAHLSLSEMAKRFSYSPFYLSRVFSSASGMQLRHYVQGRALAFAAIEIRDTRDSILSVALRYGFQSHEAFTRAFKKAYGLTPSEYRKTKVPLVLRTAIRPFDCYLMEERIMVNQKESKGGVQSYFIRMPAHKFLHIRNYESIGYWDFWQKQSLIKGQDCETICGLLSSIPGNLDNHGGEGSDASSGQLMAWINAPTGRICSWGIPLAEAYGVRLPANYDGPVPEQMILMDVPEGEYVVFEHGPFDFETESVSVEAKVEKAMKEFDYASKGYELDLTPERVFYFYHDCSRFFKYVRPVKRVDK